MQMVKKFLIALLVVLISAMVFAPKERLFFLAEEKLALNDAVISNEKLNSKLFGIDILKGSVSIKGITIATFDEIDISTLLFVSSFKVSNVVLDASSQSMVPINDFNLSVTHSLFMPSQLGLTLRYQDKELEGKLKLLDEGIVRIEFEDINGSEWLKPMMQEDEKGWYYESTI